MLRRLWPIVPALLLALPVLAQDDDAATLGLVGVWEGYDSTGTHLRAEIRELEDGVSVEVGFVLTGSERAAESIVTYAVRSPNESMTYLVTAGAAAAVAVTRLADSAARWTWADGREAVLVQVSTVDPSRAPLTVSSAAFNPTVQARLLALDGDWEADDGNRYHIRVADPANGRLEWYGVHSNRDAAVRTLLVQRAFDDGFRVAFDPGGEAQRFRWAPDGSLTIEYANGTVVRLQRGHWR